MKNVSADLPVESLICLRPFYALELHLKGDVSVCCPAWGRVIVGNIREKSLKEIWNDKPIRKMRSSMLADKWEGICRPNCPAIGEYLRSGSVYPLASAEANPVTAAVTAAVRRQQVHLETLPTSIGIANDRTCNIDCIMCGGRYFARDDSLVGRGVAEVRNLLPDLRELFLSGHGDPFASPDVRQLLLDLENNPRADLTVNLLTNGLLLPRYWARLKDVSFGYVNLSVDAATRETYEAIRRGGRWEDLLASLALLQRERGNVKRVIVNMTVMRENYREIPAFVELAAAYGCAACITKIRGEWGGQNIFSKSDGTIFAELKSLLSLAVERSITLGVHFDYSAFSDILADQYPSRFQSTMQRVSGKLLLGSYRVRQILRSIGVGR